MNKLWYEEALFYHIYPLGFCDAPEFNDYSSEPVERLNKICDWIPHMKSLGVTALYLGPLFESESHGYDTVDYCNVDRRLGTNETLKNVIKTLHENGIKVVLDGVFNHVSRNFFAFKDLMLNGESSRYGEWFKDVDFNNTSPMGDNFSYGCWSGCFNLPGLNLKNSFVENHILNAITFWVQELDIDGLRLDVADVLDFDFMKELSSFSRTIKKDFWLMGEVIHGDYTNWVNPEMLDSTTNYECYKGMYSSFNDSNFYEVAFSLNRLFNSESGLYRDLRLYNFVDNHDVNRIASTISDKKLLYPLYILLFSIPGIPSIYYGSEWEIEGIKENSSDSAIRPCLDISDIYRDRSQDLKNAISGISSIWHSSDALKHGTYKELFVSSTLFAFMREYGDEKIVVIVNSSDKEERVIIPLFCNVKFGCDLLNDNESFEIIGREISVLVYPVWGRIISLKS